MERISGGYVWAAYAVTLLLAWLFQRSRVAVAVLALAALGLMARYAEAPTTVALAGVAFSVVLGCLALVRDRGVTSLAGVVQLAGAGAVAGLIALVAAADPAMVSRTMASRALPAGLTAWTRLPQVLLLAAVLAAAAATWATVRWRGAVEKGLLWAILTAAVALALTLPSAVPEALPGAPVGLSAWTLPPGPRSAAEIFLLATALTLALSMVETSYAMAYRDDLTGLPARRALQRDLAGLRGSYAVAMVDVDHFKRFNDRHGHDVGDQVLKLVATRLSRSPGGAKAYRYGGEEFTLLFRACTREEATPHLEAVREAVAGTRFALRGRGRPREKLTPAERRARKPKGDPKELSVSVSIGVADSRGRDAGPDDVLKNADQALYRAKRAGRNRVSK